MHLPGTLIILGANYVPTGRSEHFERNRAKNRILSLQKNRFHIFHNQSITIMKSRLRQLASVCSNISASREKASKSKASSSSSHLTNEANKENTLPATKKSNKAAKKSPTVPKESKDYTVINPLVGATMEDVHLSKCADVIVSTNRKSQLTRLKKIKSLQIKKSKLIHFAFFVIKLVSKV